MVLHHHHFMSYWMVFHHHCTYAPWFFVVKSPLAASLGLKWERLLIDPTPILAPGPSNLWGGSIGETISADCQLVVFHFAQNLRVRQLGWFELPWKKTVPNMFQSTKHMGKYGKHLVDTEVSINGWAIKASLVPIIDLWIGPEDVANKNRPSDACWFIIPSP